MNERIFACTIFILSIVNINHAQEAPDTYFESSYGKLEYGFYIPESYDSTRTYPLIMYLHGMGNNYFVYLDWYNSDVQTENPCFVFTPRTPVSWADWSGWWDQLTEPMIAALHVMDSLISVYPVDTSRIYVYGISMGGEGTFDLLHKRPNKFAAAMSVCGGGQPFWAENISKTPFWMFHGSEDKINPPKLTEQVYDELVKIGANKMRYKKYPGYGHEIWDVAASEPSWHDWMFAHSKDDTLLLKPSTPIELAGSITENDKIRLSWNDIRNPNKRENKIWYYKIYNKDSLIGSVEYDKTIYEFPAISEIDTFKVSAVNYHFKESDKSNFVYYDNGSIGTGVHDFLKVERLNYILHQNYPNPFNPKTKISFSISKKSFVTLSIYDMLGKVIAVVMNEEKYPGHYSIELDFSNLSKCAYSLQPLLIKINNGKTN
ncbi:MAG: alpha/beta hydrolase-fold protein [Calditrichaceae bacterium]